MLATLRQRNFALLWIAGLISVAGDFALLTALPLHAYALTGSALASGAVFAASLLPRVVLSSFAGVFVDRWDRQRTMVVADLMRAIALLPLLAVGSADLLWLLYLVRLATGTLALFFNPAESALLPRLVGEERLVAANALNALNDNLGRLGGPALGGVLYATGGLGTLVVVDAASFVVSVTTLLLIRTLPRAPSREGDLVARIKEGIVYTRAHRWLWVALVVAAIGNLFAYGPLMALLPLVADQRLDVSASGYGFLLACFGLGAAAAMLVSGQMGAPKRRVTAIYAGWFVADLCLTGIGVTPSLVVAMILYGTLGFCLEYGNVLWVAMLQDLVPAEVLGRVSSLDWMLSVSMIPIAVAIAGPAAETVGLSTVLVAGGLGAAVITIIGWLRPGVRDPELDADAREQTSTV